MAGFEFEVNGRRFANFISGSVFKSIETLSGTFSIVATAERGNPYPVRRGDEIKIFIEDQRVLSGYIDSISISGSATDHKIEIRGRDRTNDIIDSSLVTIPEFSPPISLKSIVEKVLAANGIDNVQVQQISRIEPFKAGEQVSAKPGENIWDFINKYCMKRQVLAGTDVEGNVVLQRVGGVFFKAPIVHEKDNPKNNVLSYTFEDTEEERFNQYTVTGQQNPVALDQVNSSSSADVIVNNRGSVQDPEIRRSRQKLIDSDTSQNGLNAGQTASWEANLRRARGFTYSCIVQGYYGIKPGKFGGGIIWTNNRLVPVRDEYCDLDAVLLLKSVKFNLDLTSGSTTELEFTYRDAYSLEVVRTAIESRTSKTAGDFVSK